MVYAIMHDGEPNGIGNLLSDDDCGVIVIGKDSGKHWEQCFLHGYLTSSNSYTNTHGLLSQVPLPDTLSMRAANAPRGEV